MDFKEILSSLLGTITEFCTTAGIKIVISILVLLIGFKLIKVLINTFKREDKLTKIDASIKSFLASFLGIALKIVLLITVAGYLGLPMTSVITVLGSAAVAVGLSLQGSLSNLAGGIMIVLFKPFKVGDYIEAGALSGTVAEIGIFYTKLKTPENKVVILPNGGLSNQNVTNYSECELRRVDIAIGVDYGSDPEKVKAALLKIADANEKTLKDPAPFVGVTAYKDSSIDFVLRTWCNNADYWDVFFGLNEALLEEFRKENISIPYPQVDVHMK